jgi:uncharacterized membrane protein YgcG
VIKMIQQLPQKLFEKGGGSFGGGGATGGF